MKKNYFIALFLALSLSIGLANAQSNSDEAYPYAGLGLGYGKLSDDDFNDKDRTIKLFGGYSFNKNFAAEIEYNDFGKYTYSLADVHVPATTSATIKPKSWGFSGILKGRVFSNVELFGKLGFHVWKADVDDGVITDGRTFEVRLDKNDGTDVFGGVGANIHLNNFAVRLEYERFKLDDGDIDLISAGLIYKF